MLLIVNLLMHDTAFNSQPVLIPDLLNVDKGALPRAKGKMLQS
jgi:hypothetical protein